MNPTREPHCSVLWIVVAVSVALHAAIAIAQTNPDFALGPERPSVHPWQDDAALHCVQFLGTKTGWAGGDHGTLWATEDGGQTWARLPVPTDASIRSISFLTNRFGFIAGRATQSYTRTGAGFVLRTKDGGHSWERAGYGLPPISSIRFFGPEEGVAVGESSADFPTGVMLTTDGGETWTSAGGPAADGWLTAAFHEPHEGVVAGPGGRVAMFAAASVAPPRVDPGSRRSIHALDMADGFQGWAVGDGALILQTTNGAVSWEPAAEALSRRVSRFMDFRAVAARGKSVWIAGSPGSVIWRSLDGVRWTAGRTGQAAPIHALHFSDEMHGWAAGAFGTILRTTDGGLTWQAVRGASRRAAMLTVHSTPGSVPFNTLIKFAGEQGFRTYSIVVPAPEAAPDGSSPLSFRRQLDDSVVTVGAAGAESGWRLSLPEPDLQSDAQRLTAAWQEQTEGELVETVLSNLVARIRMWRPSVILLDAPHEEDAAAKLLQDAVVRAIGEAGDATQFPDQIQYGGLRPWTVERIYSAAPPDAAAGRSVISVRPFEVLPRLGATAELLASTGRSKLIPPIGHRSEIENWIPVDGRSGEAFTLVAVRDLWDGIRIAPGSDARRPSLPFDDRRTDELAAIAVRQRNFRGIVDHYGHSPVKAAQLLAEMRSFTKGLPAAQAAHQLAALAADYRRHARWELAEATLIELVNLYPDQPVAAEAMIWLFQYWSSAEMAWQRGRHVSLDAKRRTISRRTIVDRLEKIVEEAGRVQNDPVKKARELQLDAIGELEVTATLPSQRDSDWREAAEANWRRQAVKMATVIRNRLPTVFSQPEVEWPLAAVLRLQKQPDLADRLYRRRQTTSGQTGGGRIAAGELWLSHPADDVPAHVRDATFATLPPKLDGVFGDECWQDAAELTLHSKEGEELPTGSPYSFAMMAWDSDYLYFAASLLRDPASPKDGAQYEGRKHDMDLTGFDRISLHLDTDRDYMTSYAIHIDQRGHVAESCWEDSTWNPKMHVAVDGDAERWRIEAAIPFRELAPSPPRPGNAWAVAVRRAMPYSDRQSWVGSPRETAKPESFGLVRFR